MRHFKLAFALISLLVVGGAGSSFGADTPTAVAPLARVAARVVVDHGEVRDYKVSVIIKGTMPNPETQQPMDLDTSMVFKLKHKYSRREGDGLLPMEIMLTEGDVTMGGQTIRISPSIYPKLTVLFDRDFAINDIFGFGNVSSGALPGINYGNLAMLFHIPGLNQPHGVGESWGSKIIIPSLKEAYSVKNTVKAVSKPDANPATLTVRQEIARISMPNSTTPPPAMKATVDSVFAQDNGRLLSSHVECEVTSTTKDPKSKQDTPACRANIKMDISAIK